MRSRTPIVISLLVSMLLISSCSVITQPDSTPTEIDQPLERVSLSKRDCMNANGGLIPHLQLGVNQQINANALAGGTVRSGDFLITIWLICDPTLVADDPENPEYSWQEYSEVRYLGIASGWEIIGYNPEYEDLEIKQALTVNGEGLHGKVIGPQMMVSWGMGQGHYGPVGTEDQIVARALTAGEPIDVVLMISTTEILASAHLRVTFEETPDGYRLLSAEFGKGDLP